MRKAIRDLMILPENISGTYLLRVILRIKCRIDLAIIGDPKVFKNGREVSAWLGLFSKQPSSGNKIILGGYIYDVGSYKCDEFKIVSQVPES